MAGTCLGLGTPAVQLEAAIQAAFATGPAAAGVPWHDIVVLYDRLLALAPLGAQIGRALAWRRPMARRHAACRRWRRWTPRRCRPTSPGGPSHLLAQDGQRARDRAGLRTGAGPHGPAALRCTAQRLAEPLRPFRRVSSRTFVLDTPCPCRPIAYALVACSPFRAWPTARTAAPCPCDWACFGSAVRPADLPGRGAAGRPRAGAALVHLPRQFCAPTATLDLRAVGQDLELDIGVAGAFGSPHGRYRCAPRHADLGTLMEFGRA